jgi:hypothetical protein
MPSALRELSQLKRIFGSIPLSPDCRRDIYRRRLDEIDEQLDNWKGDPEEKGPLLAEREEVAKEVEDLGGSSIRSTRVMQPDEVLGLVDEDHPVVAVSVGPSWRERFR